MHSLAVLVHSHPHSTSRKKKRKKISLCQTDGRTPTDETILFPSFRSVFVRHWPTSTLGCGLVSVAFKSALLLPGETCHIKHQIASMDLPNVLVLRRARRGFRRMAERKLGLWWTYPRKLCTSMQKRQLQDKKYQGQSGSCVPGPCV